MDVVRIVDRRRQRLWRAAYAMVALLLAAAATFGLSRLREAAPTVDASTVWIDTVRRGPLVREVRGTGTLVPQDVRWIPAATSGRVEQIVIRPGTSVHADTVVLRLSNPQLDQELQEAQLRVQSAEASLANLRVQVQNETLQQRANAAALEADYRKAQMQADMNEVLASRRLVSELVRRQSAVDAEQLGARSRIADEQLAIRGESSRTQLLVQQSTLDQARALLALRQHERDALRVRAGLSGVLQLVQVDVGQQVAAGTNLARVADPTQLKAEVKVPESQARDIALGQRAAIDTHMGIVSGHVTRLDPSVQNGTRTVDVLPDGALPGGAVPDLSIDGIIELERLGDVLFVGRPAFGQEHATVALFKVEPDEVSASRVQVQLGKGSVNTIQVVSGLQPGDRVILSDTSAWDAADRVRLRR